VAGHGDVPPAGGQVGGVTFLVQAGGVSVELPRGDVLAWLDGFLTALGRRDVLDDVRRGGYSRRAAPVAALRLADAAGLLEFVEVRRSVG